jgi:hypothetical protein
VGAGRDHSDELRRIITGLGHESELHDVDSGSLRLVLGDDDDPRRVAAAINLAAHRAGIVVHELQLVRADLEARYLSLVGMGGQR